MMRRLFWVAVGATGTVLLARRIEQKVRRYTPAGLAEQAQDTREGVTEALSAARARFAVARAEREQDLVRTLLVTPEDREARTSRSSGTARPDPDKLLYDF
ncbi:hypothetical protein [Cellulomonas bogoriensis]|uniref:Uncharacterized protein n=1 Tax=Cellulomonas bogoriensis 69B4 = DSM 16987 TaxID=1386082 RepID=A0A0A0BX03_9CELL|nr:hypothetical protein [Cellulomonas bogoriensis]KGM12933.1 hypothetical protein N869_00835 [Cellulomonas bogoriensis 69B4 = DSM 16987]